MTTIRIAEVFSSGCPFCKEAVAMVQRIACPSCDVQVLDTNDPKVMERARELGVGAVPAVAVNGQLISCCEGRGIDEQSLRDAGIGMG